MYSFYYWGIPAILDLPSKSDILEEKIFEKTNLKVSIKNPNLKMGLIPSIWFYADDISLLNDDNSKAFETSKFKINIRLIPLIQNKININYLSCEKFNLNLIFDKESKLKIGQYDLEKFPKSKYQIQKASVSIDKYDIKLDDKIREKILDFDGQYFYIDEFINNKKLDLATFVEICNKKFSIKTNINIAFPKSHISEDQIDLSVNIVNLDLSEFSPYVKYFSKNKIVRLSGIINLNADTKLTNEKHKEISSELSIKNLGIFKDDIKSSIHCEDEIKILTKIVPKNNGININDFKILGNGINAFVSGKISKLNSKIPDLNLKIGINPSKAEKIISILPGEKNLVPDLDLLLLKQTGFWGDVTGNLELKGKADYPNVIGGILIKNAYMVKPIKNAEKATIKLAFKGDRFDLDVKVPTSPDQTVWVKGPIKLDKDKTSDLNITSTDNVDLKTAQIVLNPLHKILNFELGPVPIMDIKGKGGIDLHVVGTRKNPHAWGKFFFKNGIVSFLDIHNMEITNASGNLLFDNQNTTFESKTANLNGKPISVKGTCNLFGEMNFDIISNGQDVGKLLNIIQSSPMLKDIQNILNPLESAFGNSNIKINLYGTVKDPYDIVFNKNIFAKGTIELFSDTIKLKDLKTAISKTTGVIDFKNFDTDFNIATFLNNSKLSIDGKINNNIGNLKITSDRFNLSDALKAFDVNTIYKNDFNKINTSFIAKYNGSIEKINYNNIYLKGNIYSNQDSKITINNGSYTLNNSKFIIPYIQGKINNNPYNLTLQISNAFSPKRVVNGNGKINSFDLNILNDKSLKSLFSFNKQFEDIDSIDGKTTISFRAKNNNFNIFTEISDISFMYKPKNIKVILKSGNILLHNDTLNLNKINAQIGSMPIFTNGKILNIQKNPYLNIFVNIKPTQDFFDEIFNKNSLYPIKLKGDAILSSNINGTFGNINSKSVLDIKENSSLYYMGATIGNLENPVTINLDSTYSPNRIKINNLQYDKTFISQNNKPYKNTQLTATGTINLSNDNNFDFYNFRIKTQNPTDAKIFNIIFRKPFMKQGVFTSDLVLNGTSQNPKILGKLNITSIDIPLFDSTIRDINLDFKHDKIYITGKGKVITNDVNIETVVKNQLVPPYVINNLKLNLADLNINKIINTLIEIEAESTKNITTMQNQIPFDINQLIIQNADIQADKVHVRNISADNFKANLKITPKKIIDLNKFTFDIAEGNVFGAFKYNLPNKNANLDIHLNNANASIMSEALFDLKGQVFGTINGDFNLTCKASENDNCFKTLSGNGSFKIADGRMPKLGSLEYLLKAGNLIKSGITGLSINGLIDLITPLKTGEFESIYGDVHLEKGIANEINIYSKGKDLNMYMTGSYNIVTSVASMEIFGSLSKNITSVLSKIKNVSLNTLFNTIPGISDTKNTEIMENGISKIPNINNTSNIYKIFKSEINGDINGNSYVKSFEWVK